MKILIKALAKSQAVAGPSGPESDYFPHEAEARAFADTLQARIQAPHRFPISQQHSAAG